MRASRRCCTESPADSSWVVRRTQPRVARTRRSISPSVCAICRRSGRSPASRVLHSERMAADRTRGSASVAALRRAARMSGWIRPLHTGSRAIRVSGWPASTPSTMAPTSGWACLDCRRWQTELRASLASVRVGSFLACVTRRTIGATSASPASSARAWNAATWAVSGPAGELEESWQGPVSRLGPQGPHQFHLDRRLCRRHAGQQGVRDLATMHLQERPASGLLHVAIRGSRYLGQEGNHGGITQDAQGLDG